MYATLIALGALARGLGLWLGQRESTEAMASPALGFGGLVLLPIYLLSFHEPAKTVVEHLWIADGWRWAVLLGFVYLGVAVSWIGALSPTRDGDVAEKKTDLALLGSTILVTIGIAAGNEIILPVTANLALLMVAGALLWEAVVGARRQQFWLGLGLFVLVVVSRFVEWDTHLMVKSVVFILGGIGVTIGGVRFEKSLKAKGTT